MKKIVIVCLAILVVSPAFASDGAEQDNYLGAGALIRTRPYQDVDAETLPVPIIFWREGKFFLDGRRVGYDLYSEDGVKLSAVLKPNLMGYDDEDSTALNGMEDREWSLDAGARGRWEIPDSGDIALNLEVLADILAKSEGQQITLSIDKKIKGDIFRLVPSAGVKWQSESLVDYYYGVKTSEATATRAAYEPDGVVNYYVDVEFSLGLSENWVLTTVLNYEFLGDEIDDSPIVEDNYIFSAVVGIVRKF